MPLWFHKHERGVAHLFLGFAFAMQNELESLRSLSYQSSNSKHDPSVAKFSLKQVLAIVEKAVRAREAELQEEFSEVLAQRLQGVLRSTANCTCMCVRVCAYVCVRLCACWFSLPCL